MDCEEFVLDFAHVDLDGIHLTESCMLVSFGVGLTDLQRALVDAVKDWTLVRERKGKTGRKCRKIKGASIVKNRADCH